jgi:hypothetical protein
MRETRLQIAYKDIVSHFSALGQRVFKRSDIGRQLQNKRVFWRLAATTSTQKLIDFLSEKGHIKQHVFAFPRATEIRFTWSQVTDYEIILSLKPKSYLTHFTALYLHGLTLQAPKTIYLNFEQPERPRQKGALEQSRVDFAFSRRCRVSTTIAEYGGSRVCILNGMQTGNRGVVELEDDLGNPLKVSSLERTLIDIAVRPVYAGGVYTVMMAYKEAASKKVSINKLAAMLSSMAFTYPYHQVIGFYLERAGNFGAEQISLLDKYEKKLDFYLDYQIKEKEYSKRWRLFYPRGL